MRIVAVWLLCSLSLLVCGHIYNTSIAQLQDRFHLYTPQDYRPSISASYVSNTVPQDVFEERNRNQTMYEITAFVLGYKNVLIEHTPGEIRRDPELDHVRQYLSRHMAWYSVYRTYVLSKACDNVLLYTSEGRHDAITYIICDVLKTNTLATRGLLLGYPEEDVRFLLYREYVRWYSEEIFNDLHVGQQGEATDVTRRKPTDITRLSLQDYEKIREYEPAKTHVENAMKHAKDQIEQYRQYSTSELVQWMRNNTHECFTFDQFIVQPDIAGILHDLYHALDYCARYIL